MRKIGLVIMGLFLVQYLIVGVVISLFMEADGSLASRGGAWLWGIFAVIVVATLLALRAPLTAGLALVAGGALATALYEVGGLFLFGWGPILGGAFFCFAGLQRQRN